MAVVEAAIVAMTGDGGSSSARGGTGGVARVRGTETEHVGARRASRREGRLSIVTWHCDAKLVSKEC